MTTTASPKYPVNDCRTIPQSRQPTAPRGVLKPDRVKYFFFFVSYLNYQQFFSKMSRKIIITEQVIAVTEFHAIDKTLYACYLPNRQNIQYVEKTALIHE